MINLKCLKRFPVDFSSDVTTTPEACRIITLVLVCVLKPVTEGTRCNRKGKIMQIGTIRWQIGTIRWQIGWE